MANIFDACRKNDVDEIKRLLEQGQDVNCVDVFGYSPLMVAVTGGRTSVVYYLIEDGGANVNKRNKQNNGLTALHFACERGQLEIAKALLEHGALKDGKDYNGRTPIMVAADWKTYDVARFLITVGADLEGLKGDRGVNLFLSAMNNNHLELLNALLTHGIGLSGLEDTQRYKLFMRAAKMGYDEILKQLILHSPSGLVNHQDADGWTALHHAARHNQVQCGILLAEAGANLKITHVQREIEQGIATTPLDLACTEFKDAIMQTLSFNTRKTVCVIGNEYSGKSTLIASLQNENANFWKKVYHWLFGVKKISERTAGIEPVFISSNRYGDVGFFDFAGQHQYHGPHEMFLEAILNKRRSTVTIIVVVKATDEEPIISEQLQRWLHPVSKMSPSTNPIRIIVIGSHYDKVKSKAAAKEKLERCYERVRQSLCEVPLEFLDVCYLDCRQPYASDLVKLCAYLNEVPIPEYKATKMPYSICWVVSQIKTSLDSKAIRVEDFSEWIIDNKPNLPSNLPPAEEVCEDLSSTGHFLYLPNKEDSFNGWLVLELTSILKEVYGTLFPSKISVTEPGIESEFGLLSLHRLANLFPRLNLQMICDVLINLEFCIKVDSSILEKKIFKLADEAHKNREYLFFPALISSERPKCFQDTSLNRYTLCWQLEIEAKCFLSPRLLQTIILRLAGQHVFYDERGYDTREHYCSVWSTGIFWQSIEDADVAVQITDNAILQVIGRSKVGPEALCSYISTITQDIFATIRELSPTLSATAYIIHPADPQVLLENPRSPCPQDKFKLTVMLNSIKKRKETCLSLKTTVGERRCTTQNEQARRIKVEEAFCGFKPSQDTIQKLCFECDLEALTDSPPTTPIDPLLIKPTLNMIEQHIIRFIAPDWYSVGLHLEIEVDNLKIIEADIYPPSVEKCCRTMFTRWLSHDEGTGGAPRIWRTVLKALKDVGYNSLVGDVERTLFE